MQFLLLIITVLNIFSIHKQNKKRSSVAGQLETKRINDQEIENPSQMTPLSLAGNHRTAQRVSAARPRPDHLPLGSPDPRAHPVYSGLASLTGNLKFDH